MTPTQIDTNKVGTFIVDKRVVQTLHHVMFALFQHFIPYSAIEEEGYDDVPQVIRYTGYCDRFAAVATDQPNIPEYIMEFQESYWSDQVNVTIKFKRN